VLGGARSYGCKRWEGDVGKERENQRREKGKGDGRLCTRTGTKMKKQKLRFENVNRGGGW